MAVEDEYRNDDSKKLVKINDSHESLVLFQSS
jgi:hypothetical protein